jgi:pyrroloquinoline quinone biosynthesis protein B
LNRYFPVEPLLAHFARPAWVDLPLDDPLLLPPCRAGCKPATRHEGLLLRAFALGPHVPRFAADGPGEEPGSVVGLLVHDVRTGGKLVYAPCVSTLSEPLTGAAKEADAILLDGTFWSDGEPLTVGRRSALDMGHVPVSGPHGSLAWLADLPVRHRVYIHINNTNPMLNEHSSEYRLVADAGVGVGADGDGFDL